MTVISSVSLCDTFEMVLSTCRALNKCCSSDWLTVDPWVFSHPFLNLRVGHEHNTLFRCNPLFFIFAFYFALFISSGFTSVWLIRVRKENVRNMGLMNQRKAIYIKMPNLGLQHCQEKMVGFHQWSA